MATQDTKTPLTVESAPARDDLKRLVHDLRTPLVAVRGYTRMILDGRAGPVNETQREYLGIVAANAENMIHRLKELEAAAMKEEPLPPFVPRAEK